MMWRAKGSLGPAVEKVLPTLICVMQCWPLCSICTSDEDNKEVFALAATLAVWVIVQVPECHEAMILYSSCLFVALLFHVVITTQQTPPEEVVNFWRTCQEEHHLPSDSNGSQSSWPSHATVTSTRAPSVTWALFCPQYFRLAGAFQAQLQDLLTRRFSEPSLLQVAINPVTDMEQRPPRVPKLAWLEEEEEGPGAAQAQETEEVQQFQPLQEGQKTDGKQMEQRPPSVPKLAWVEEEEKGPGPAPAMETEEVQPFQPLQDDAAMDWTQEHKPAHGRFRRTAQLVCKLIKSIRQERTSIMDTRVIAYSEIFKHDIRAALLDMLVEIGVSSPEQVPNMVRYIHQWLMANESAERKMDKTLLDLTDAQPDDVVMTLLRVAPSCDRFAVQTLKSLLCLVQCEHVVVSMERKRGWDTLLCVDTHHYAVGLLAREMGHASMHLCKSILCCLLEMLSKDTQYWDFPTLAFLVEVLECMDLSGCSDSIMNVLSRHLRSQRTETRRQVLRALLLLRDDPSLTQRMWTLTKSFVELLQENDSDVIRMTIFLLSYLFLDKDTPIPSPIALTLAEVLLPLFDNDDSQVQLLSMFVFRTLMSFVVEEGRKPLKRPVCQSLVPLFFHCQDENLLVAEASRTTLLRAAQFLKKRDLEKPVKKEKLWKFVEVLLADDRSRAEEHVRQALPYLESPQEPLREAAIRFIALEHLTEDISTVVSDLALQTLYVLRALQSGRYSVFQRLQDQFRRAWKMRPRLSGFGWLHCWRSAES
ncbi:hypothetical protein DUI87_30811 [Hirundo rustica rustica]|uniref:Maestro/Maestro-like HEAT-repeats domain-containing protein n=1 Tax=Hirundo rustica rustica TaxID=333673 RepID=A0A3M0ITQ9_HIRRU|nr:hypothetical protein DUI87_30811 [Hirundo rustica rustica]